MQDSRKHILLFEAQNPTQDDSVFGDYENFVHTMFNSAAPTMFMYRASYLKGHGINLEEIFQFNFLCIQEVPILGIREKLMCQMKHA